MATPRIASISFSSIAVLCVVGCVCVWGASGDIVDKYRNILQYRDGDPSNPSNISPYYWSESASGQERLLFRKTETLVNLLNRVTPAVQTPAAADFERLYCDTIEADVNIAAKLVQREPIECVARDEEALANQQHDYTSPLFECMGKDHYGQAWTCPSNECFQSTSTVDTSGQLKYDAGSGISMTHVAVPAECNQTVLSLLSQSGFHQVNGIMQTSVLNKLPASLLPKFVLRDDPPYWTWLAPHTTSHVQTAVMGMDVWIVGAQGSAVLALECHPYLYKETAARPTGLGKVFPFYNNLDLHKEFNSHLQSYFGKKYTYQITPGMSVLIPAGCIYQLWTLDQEFRSFSGPFMSPATRAEGLKSLQGNDSYHHHTFASALFEAKSRPALRASTLLRHKLDEPHADAWKVGTPMDREMAELVTGPYTEPRVFLCVDEDLASELMLSLWLGLPEQCRNRRNGEGGEIGRLACEDVWYGRYGLYLRSNEFLASSVEVSDWPALMVFNGSKAKIIPPGEMVHKLATRQPQSAYTKDYSPSTEVMSHLTAWDIIYPVYAEWVGGNDVIPPIEHDPSSDQPSRLRVWYHNVKAHVTLPESRIEWFISSFRLATAFLLLGLFHGSIVVLKGVKSFLGRRLRKSKTGAQQRKRK